MDVKSPLTLSEWVMAESNSSRREFRMAVHTILLAIERSPFLHGEMIVKGGILLAIYYGSTRFTKDIDFSTTRILAEFDEKKVLFELELKLIDAVETLDYGLDCRIQSSMMQPPSFRHPTFPTFQMNIGYACKGTNAHKRLLVNQATTIIPIDYSLNETIVETTNILFEKDETIRAYSLTDIVAEKYRALLQQEIRNRVREQDIYDIYYLLHVRSLADHIDKRKLLECMKRKCRTRDVDLHKNSFSIGELRQRAERHYYDLRATVIDLPPFVESFSFVQSYYESLPWSE